MRDGCSIASIKSGFRAVDFGCGPIGIMNLLSERVGSDGVVIGIERETRYAAMARVELSERNLRNVRVIDGNALKTGLEKSSYDLVHAQLVLINLPPAFQQELLAEMLSLLKPGGTIALQEFDSASYVCYPEHPSWNILLSIWNDSFHAKGGNALPPKADMCSAPAHVCFGPILLHKSVAEFFGQ